MHDQHPSGVIIIDRETRPAVEALWDENADLFTPGRGVFVELLASEFLVEELMQGQVLVFNAPIPVCSEEIICAGITVGVLAKVQSLAQTDISDVVRTDH